MECRKHIRGNDYSIIEIDDTYCNDADLELTGTEENLIYGTDMLAAHLMEKAYKEKNKYERKKVFDDIVYLYKKADKIIMNHMNHLLGRAFVSLLDDETMEGADLKLSEMLLEGLNYIPPHTFGRSVVEFEECQCKRNLNKQFKLLRIKDKIKYKRPEGIRTDISYNLLRLGEIEKAKLGFELALKSNPNCVLALIGLSIILLINHSKSPHTINLSVHFSNQLTVNTMKVETLFKIAFDYSMDEKFDKAIFYSNIILYRSRNVYQIAECLNLLGKIYELKYDFNRSLEYYYRAVHINPKEIGYSLYGLAKMYIYNCSYDKAQLCLERYLQKNQNCNKTKMMLCLLYIRIDNEDENEEAQAYLNEVINEDPNCLEAWVGLGLLAINRGEDLTNIYREILNLTMDNNVSFASIDLIIDTAFIYNYCENYAACWPLLEAAVDYLKDIYKISPCLYFEFLNRIANVRLADVYLKLQKFSKAKNLLKTIIQNDPDDIESILKMAHLCQNHQNEACEYAKKALLLNPRCTEALKILKKFNVETEIGLTEFNGSSLKNLICLFINLEKIANQSTKNEIVNKDKEFDNLAAQLFGYLLNSDPEYIWSPDGLGHHLATSKMLSKLKNTFSTAEKSDILCKTWIYYAENCIRYRLHDRFMETLELCLKLFFLHDTLKIYTLIGFQCSSANNYQESKIFFSKSFMADPGDFNTINNFSFLLQDIGDQMLDNKECTTEDVYEALENIQLAEKYYNFLLKQNNVVIHGSANEGLLICKLKLGLSSFFKQRARKMEMKLKASNS